MDSPLLFAALALLALGGAGYFFARWSWSRPLAALGAIILLLQGLFGLLR